MSFDNVNHYAKDAVTGGGGDALDGIDVTAVSFIVGSVCRVYENSSSRAMKIYVSEDSGASADGSFIVIPSGGYSGNIRWHLYSSSGSGGGGFSLAHIGLPAAWTSGGNEAEVFRWALAAGETLSVTRLRLTPQGGGLNADIGIDIYDEDASTVIASTTGGVLGSGDLGVSGSGNDVIVRVWNDSGIEATACIEISSGVG